jgi:hypothetical protein
VFETRFKCCGFVEVFVLQAQTLREAEERPSIVSGTSEVFPVN